MAYATKHYSIADLTVELHTDSNDFGIQLPGALQPFETDPVRQPDLVVTLRDNPDTVPALPDSDPADDTTSDMGRVRLWAAEDGWTVCVTDRSGRSHIMTADAMFSHATMHCDPISPEATAALNSLLRIAFSQTALSHGAISIHASAVTDCAGAYLFLGPSGTGKSTHARLWTESFPQMILLNDDNPIIRLTSTGKVMAYGSPWSGKTPCYRPVSAPLRAIVRLRQAPGNSFRMLHDIEAFTAILPSCSTIRSYPPLFERLCDIVAILAETVTIGTMECRPDSEAALTCARAVGQTNTGQIGISQ